LFAYTAFAHFSGVVENPRDSRTNENPLSEELCGLPRARHTLPDVEIAATTEAHGTAPGTPTRAGCSCPYRTRGSLQTGLIPATGVHGGVRYSYEGRRNLTATGREPAACIHQVSEFGLRSLGAPSRRGSRDPELLPAESHLARLADRPMNDGELGARHRVPDEARHHSAVLDSGRVVVDG
jgi:hypothetical protein